METTHTSAIEVCPEFATLLHTQVRYYGFGWAPDGKLAFRLDDSVFKLKVTEPARNGLRDRMLTQEDLEEVLGVELAPEIPLDLFHFHPREVTLLPPDDEWDCYRGMSHGFHFAFGNSGWSDDFIGGGYLDVHVAFCWEDMRFSLLSQKGGKRQSMYVVDLSYNRAEWLYKPRLLYPRAELKLGSLKKLRHLSWAQLVAYVEKLNNQGPQIWRWEIGMDLLWNDDRPDEVVIVDEHHWDEIRTIEWLTPPGATIRQWEQHVARWPHLYVYNAMHWSTASFAVNARIRAGLPAFDD